ncbi:RsmB/NOP family class I SAM-dependent RNA methyltransferase [Bartonella sp. DGB1]|uniref:RsmB/NOP family class I SAM-dependent RNA methyltransferase n=1 Tax=Bartonella sp. DGB1 TaxID=3239807 RepID=UPI0035242201
MNTNKLPLNTSGLKTRIVALRLLTAIIKKHQSMDALTDNEHGHPQYLSLTTADRLLVKAILGASLRHRAEILQILTLLLNKKLSENAVTLENLLIISLAQLLYLKIPDYAIINTAVEITKKDPRLNRFSSLVNGILRNYLRKKDQLKTEITPLKNTPQWFKNQLEEFYGIEKTNQILYKQTLEPTLDITVKANPEIWAEKLNAIILPNQSLRLLNPKQDITHLAGFDDGQWWVQDFSASLPAKLLGDLNGKNVVDLCAAPGGKTAQLINQGAKVVAVDISTNRIKRLKQNLDRLSMVAECNIADLKNYQPTQLFEVILLDAPCSSTGTIRRHPDILWTKTEEDIKKLTKLQFELLEASLNFAKENAIILFSNCSILPQEGEYLVEEFLQKHSSKIKLLPFEPSELPPELAILINKKGYLRTTPADFYHENDALSGMDGFFAARFLFNNH